MAMKFVNRLAYYLGGLSLGMICFFFFFIGKGAPSCTWFPEGRVLNDFKRKAIYFSPEISNMLENKDIDTLSIQMILAYGDVDFSKSITDTVPCKFYHVSGKQELKDVTLWVKNCSNKLIVEKVLPVEE